eukprot:TRINITY_DN957_c0_g1_i2.p1 TRINITY_DN957_c0_g1~~TRINITY_DN957_c0_g1_i2.p1  ORF type:complete len:241 (-),score=22.80 TRINITY_DN957_c0_g1_i2:223-945(-)
MALNTPLLGRYPATLPSEHFVVIVHSASLVFRTEAGVRPPYYTRCKRGQLFLSSWRIVFVDASQSFSISIPLSHIQNCTIKRPLFGKKFLQGSVNPVERIGLGVPTQFNLFIPCKDFGLFTDALRPLVAAARGLDGGIEMEKYFYCGHQYPCPRYSGHPMGMSALSVPAGTMGYASTGPPVIVCSGEPSSYGYGRRGRYYQYPHHSCVPHTGDTSPVSAGGVAFVCAHDPHHCYVAKGVK